MNQRQPLIITAILTAFSIVVIAAVAVQLNQPQAVAATVNSSNPLPANLDPSVAAIISQREAAYQQALDQANQRLQQANDQLAQAYSHEQDLANQLAQAQQQIAALQQQSPAQPNSSSNPNNNNSAAPQYAVSAAQAAQIALNAMPNAQLMGDPQLVNIRGIIAYEVPLDQGRVYVDANSGQVLNGGSRFGRGRNSQPPVAPAPNTNGSSGNTN